MVSFASIKQSLRKNNHNNGSHSAHAGGGRGHHNVGGRENEHGVDQKHRKGVAILGQVGFVAKAIVYGLIGGITIGTAIGQKRDSSPQGVFLLLGDNAVGIPLLVIMAVCLVAYSCWRFAEGFTGQGSDAHFSKSKNIFKYRVSPIISGLVYLAYTYYVIRTMFLDPAERTSSSTSTTKTRFPDSWAHAGAGGIFGLAVLGLAFLIATLIQFAVAFTGSFKMDLYMNRMRNKWVRWTVFALGHVGFFARGLVFLLVSIMLFRSAANPNKGRGGNGASVTDQAIQALATLAWGKALLIVLGVGLILYAIFALANVHYKIFPTPPRSRIAEIDTDHDKFFGSGNQTRTNTRGSLNV